MPLRLREALAPVTLVVGHYGVGKTNFAINLAVDLASEGKRLTVIDLDIVNPYFRASEQRSVLEANGVSLVAPVFAELGTSLDVPSLTGAVVPAIERASDDDMVIIDVGGDDAGSVALGRFAGTIRRKGYSMLAVVNRFRNLVQQPADAVENLREIEAACGLGATAIVDNAHLKSVTDSDVVRLGFEHALEVGRAAELELVAVTAPAHLAALTGSSVESFVESQRFYPVRMYVRTPWE